MDTLIKKRTFNSKLFKPYSSKIAAKHRPYFLKTLAELLKEGFSLNQSLTFMQLLMKPQAPLIQQMIQALGQGQTFEKSIQPLGYPISVVAQLFYAQKQGRFIVALEASAAQLKQIQSYQSKIIKVITYPALMGVFLIALLFGMRTLLLPHIISFIAQDVYDSNLLIRLLIGFFTFLPQISLFTFALLLILYFIFDFYLMHLSHISRFQLLRRLPLIKPWINSYCSYKLSRELGYFFEGGYSLQQTIDVLTLYPVDPFLTEIALQLKHGMMQGTPLATIISEMQLFSDELPLIIYQGELTSQMAQKCNVYSDKLFHDLWEDIAKKINYIQPLMFLLIAILVMAMYLTMMLPMLTIEF